MKGKGYRFINNQLGIEIKGRSNVETKDKNLMDQTIIWNYSRNSAEKGFATENKLWLKINVLDYRSFFRYEKI